MLVFLYSSVLGLEPQQDCKASVVRLQLPYFPPSTQFPWNNTTWIILCGDVVSFQGQGNWMNGERGNDGSRYAAEGMLLLPPLVRSRVKHKEWGLHLTSQNGWQKVHHGKSFGLTHWIKKVQVTASSAAQQDEMAPGDRFWTTVKGQQCQLFGLFLYFKHHSGCHLDFLPQAP